MDRIDDRLLAPGTGARARKRRYAVALARNESERREAQALRWRVFAQELGARLPSRTPGIDHDIFDPYCEHLIVRDEESGEVIGTYRMLAPEGARRIGCLYSESEFDLTRLQLLRDRMLEIGRSCIHPAHRSGAVILLLWSGLARFMEERNCTYLAGCASMSMADGGHAAADVARVLSASHLAPAEYQVFPRCPLPLEGLGSAPAASARVELPPLLKGYLRCGAWVCGDPAWDPDFNTADFFVFLSLAHVEARYARHYLGAAVS
jgi:putative hemolysin